MKESLEKFLESQSEEVFNKLIEAIIAMPKEEYEKQFKPDPEAVVRFYKELYDKSVNNSEPENIDVDFKPITEEEDSYASI